MNYSQTVRRLLAKGLISMGDHGVWEPTVKGRELLEEVVLLERLAAARDQRTQGDDGSGTRAGRRTQPTRGRT